MHLPHFNLYKIPSHEGTGYVREVTYHEGLFISYGDFVFHDDLQKRHEPIAQNFIEMIYLESGSLTRTQKGLKSTLLKPGINLFINNHKPITLHYEANKPVRFVIITLFDSFYDEYIRTKFPDESLSLLEIIKHINSGYDTAEIAFIFKQIEQKMCEQFYNRIYYESKIGEIISIIMSNASSHIQKKVSLSKPDRVALEDIAVLLQTHLCDRPTIDQLASLAHMSPTKLKTAFKNYYGQTIGNYSLDMRLRHALDLLAHQQLSITEIAALVGYTNASKFSKAFYQKFSIYPKDYRRLFTL